MVLRKNPEREGLHMKRFSRLAGAALTACFSVLFAAQSFAYTSELIYNASGQPVFQYNYYGPGESFRTGPTTNECGPNRNQPCDPFTRTISGEERAAFRRTGDYWARMLHRAGPPAEPMAYDMYPVEMYNNASAGPLGLIFVAEDGIAYHVPATFMTMVQKMTPVSDGAIPFHALVNSGIAPFDLQVNRIQPQKPWNLEMVMVHEFGHSLGILATNSDDALVPTEPITPFESYLRYDKTWEAAADPLEPRWFFHGPRAMKVFGGPIPMEDEDHGQEKSHFGLRNTSMTHRVFRNYTAFVEVELAALADAEYPLDLREFFGRSVYTDGETIVNSRGFFARNQAGTAYLPGMPNLSPYGMGLHIYGNNNTVYQTADLLADGPGAAGIRSDGANTRLFIAPGVRVTANGPQGTGLLVAYGSKSEITHRGHIEALGDEGDAVRFDIGVNSLDQGFEQNPDGYGALAQYSYLDIKNLKTKDPTVIDEFTKAALLLDGPLVDRFDITGSIVASRNAVYIGGNSHVREINIMRGASVQGRMVNDYYLYRGDRATEVTFGRAADPDGQRIPGQNDPEFRYVINDDILGWGAPEKDGPFSGRGLFDLAFHAGQTTLSPWAAIKVNRFTLHSGASFLATANFSTPNQVRANDVQLAPGSTVGLSRGFHLGPELKTGEPHPVFSLALTDGSSGTLVARNNFAAQGPLEVGIYDYPSYDLRWLDASATGKTLALTPTGPGRRNRQRAGDQATGAPLQMAVSDQSWQKVLHRPAQAWPISERQDDGLWQHRVWGGPYYSGGKHTGGNGLDATTVRTPGVVIGYEGLGESFMAGLALAASWPTAKGGDYENQGRSWALSAYFGYLLPLKIELGVAASYGMTKFDQERTSSGVTYTADYDGDIVRTGLTMGRRFAVNEQFSLRPEMVWEYTHLSLESYRERGWGLQAQTRDSTSTDLWRSDLGVALIWQPTEAASFMGRLGWAHIYGDRHTDAKAHFTADPANRFRSCGTRLDRDSLRVGVAASLPLGQNVSITLDYQGEFGPDSRAHGGDVMAVVRF